MPLEEGGPTGAHLAVLELLEIDVPDSSRTDRLRLSPKCIAHSTGYKDSNYIGVVCRELEDVELVEKEEPGYYSITWRGEAYLKGEVNADTLEPSSDE
ncbi:hypothetical protein [Natrarchaeobius chitinivorans]|uniref:MarR family transcriptional regulator n=1 Tax=Natrarchaeobius chitinivorans TaxID=1679083 RepID=A0A3N6MV90_NATCH|nr:hypothetical protein [Natrarchaeobius chitinivorans]RQG89342.1 hypothetical protein EA473_22310 [Natrarchaeobius chitinivorans]